MSTLYVNKPGSTVVHTKDGGSKTLLYGDPVPNDIAAYVDVSTFADSTPRRSTSEEIERARQASVAVAQETQPGSSASPLPGNYDDLNEEEAAQLIRNLPVNHQAAVLMHEIVNGGSRQMVVDAADPRALESARNQLGALPEDQVDYEPVGDTEPLASDAETRPLEPRATPAPTSQSDDDGPTLKELKDRASELEIEGRSKMDREQLEAAIAEAEAPPAGDPPPADQS